MIDIFDAFRELVTEAADPWPTFDWSDLDEDLANRPDAYLALSDQTPILRTPTLSAARLTSGHTFSIQYVATSNTEVRATVQAVSDHIERVRLPGTTPLKKIANAPIRPDLDTRAPRLYVATDVWRCARTRPNA